MSYTTKAYAYLLTISAPSRLLQYSRTNNDSHIPLPFNLESVADAYRGNPHAFPALLLSISATSTNPPSPITTLPHFASCTVGVLSLASQLTPLLARKRTSSSRTTPSSSLSRSPSFATAFSDKSTLATPMQRPSPCRSCLDDTLTPLFYDCCEESAEPDPQRLVSDAADRQSNTLAPSPSKKYL